MDNLQLRQRIVRSMIRVSERTANMRKPEKFEYRKHMTAAFMDMLGHCATHGLQIWIEHNIIFKRRDAGTSQEVNTWT